MPREVLRGVAERLWREGVPAVYVSLQRGAVHVPEDVDLATLVALLARLLTCVARACGPGCMVYECGGVCYTVLYSGGEVLVYPGCEAAPQHDYHT